MRLWGIGRLVHSQLEPLNFIPKPLAHFFAGVCRYLQVVYCNHIIGLNDRGPLESYFPLLRSSLCG